MGILALTADERVLGVKFTNDTFSVALRDGRNLVEQDAADADLRQEFAHLAQQWRSERGATSLARRMAEHPAYRVKKGDGHIYFLSFGDAGKINVPVPFFRPSPFSGPVSASSLDHPPRHGVSLPCHRGIPPG
jgi:hypothetical protein